MGWDWLSQGDTPIFPNDSHTDLKLFGQAWPLLLQNTHIWGIPLTQPSPTGSAQALPDTGSPPTGWGWLSQGDTPFLLFQK
jgi:hypothetical protein